MPERRLALNKCELLPSHVASSAGPLPTPQPSPLTGHRTQLLKPPMISTRSMWALGASWAQAAQTKSSAASRMRKPFLSHQDGQLTFNKHQGWKHGSCLNRTCLRKAGRDEEGMMGGRKEMWDSGQLHQLLHCQPQWVNERAGAERYCYFANFSPWHIPMCRGQRHS